ncbi:MAG: ATP-binding protein [Planctomycetes bacterium]|nr:ATP-binding protein [Planctomycetota bacterium]
MLVEFKVGNYRSFREEQTLSLVASNDTELPGNCVDQGKLRLLKTVGIYGPNASGKSNLINALSTMQEIIEKPAKPGKKLPVTPFKLDDKYSKKPSSFEAIFYHKKIRYQYGFTATSERIYDEWLYAYPEGRLKDIAQTWFKRKFNKKTGKTDWNFGSYLKGEKEKLKDRAINNVLLLSVGAQWNNKQLTIVYEWFVEKLRVMPSDVRWLPVTSRILTDAKEASTEFGKHLNEWIIDLLKTADLGICGIDAKQIKPEDIRFPEELSPEDKGIIVESLKKSPKFDIKTLHHDVTGKKDIYFQMKDESEGTQRYFELLGPCLETIAKSFTAVFDELERSLHPLLTRKIVELIQNSNFEKSVPQLIFATHDTTLLDPELFRRDQIWFTEKNEENATQLYSMADYKERRPRKKEAMQKGYLSGRYGAVPIIEAFELNG